MLKLSVIFAFGALACMAPTAHAQTPSAAAAQFGALEAISDISLSPDGAHIAFITPSVGQARQLYIVGTQEGAVPRSILISSGDPENLQWCRWASATRVICQVFSRARVAGNIIGASNLIAIDAAGGNVRSLSTRRGSEAYDIDFRGGEVVDWLVDDTAAVLMMRSYVPEGGTNTFSAQDGEGMGVDRVDISTGAVRHIERPRRDAIRYISDGAGQVRIMAVHQMVGQTYQLSNTIRFLYRAQSSSEWLPLSTFDITSDEGFVPAIIDAASNRAIGYRKIDGRQAVVAMMLDGSGQTETLFSNDEVDIDNIMTAGPRNRLVGVSYVTDRRRAIV
ncbi:MAG: S9 family peptidase, partial [Sphingopyxis sp.]